MRHHFPKHDTDWIPPSPWRVLLAASFLVIASVFDAWMTNVFIARGGEEASPYARQVADAGPAALLAWKALLGLSAGFLIGFFSRRRRWIWIGLQIAAVAYVLVTLLHLGILMLI